MTTAAMDDFRRFLPIMKVDKKKQMIWGYASTPSLDSDGEIVSLAAIKAALPDYLAWSNIREMHQAKAVGVTKEANIDEKGLWIGAHIVDKEAWAKVLAGVYKGFSIGGQVLNKIGNVIDKLLLAEISIVDRPANGDCRIEVIKMAKAVEGGEAELVQVTDDTISKMLEESGGDVAELDLPEVEARGFRKLLRVLGLNLGKADTQLSSPEGTVTTPSNEEDLPAAVPKVISHTDNGPGGDVIETNKTAAEPPMVFSFEGDMGKGMSEAGTLCYVFDDLRRTQRRLISEAVAEGDPADAAMAVAVGAAAQTVAGLIADIATHEAGEAASLSDEDDLRYFRNNNYGDGFAMSATNTDMEKRVSAAVKGALSEAHGHVANAIKLHGTAITCCSKMASAINDVIKAAAAGDGTVKAADLVPHMNSLHAAMSGMKDQHDLATLKMMKAMSGANGTLEGTPNLTMVSQNTMTEGNVPAVSATGPSQGKFAGMNDEAIERLIKAEADASFQKGRADALASQPVGSPRARAFNFPLDAVSDASPGNQPVQKSKKELLLDGIVIDENMDVDSASRNAGKMIGNMIKNASVFGRDPTTDPNFRGLAG